MVALPWKRRQKLERIWYTLSLAGTVAITPASDSAVGGISYFKDTHHPSSGKKKEFQSRTTTSNIFHLAKKYDNKGDNYHKPHHQTREPQQPSRPHRRRTPQQGMYLPTLHQTPPNHSPPMFPLTPFLLGVALALSISVILLLLIGIFFTFSLPCLERIFFFFFRRQREQQELDSDLLEERRTTTTTTTTAAAAAAAATATAGRGREWAVLARDLGLTRAEGILVYEGDYGVFADDEEMWPLLVAGWDGMI